MFILYILYSDTLYIYIIFIFLIFILHFISRYIILINKCKRYLLITMHCHLYIETTLKLEPEDGFMKVETCSCCVLSVNYFSCNEVGLGCKFVCFLYEGM